MADYKVRRVAEVKAKLGESPVWSVEDQALFWVDIYGLTVNRFDPATGANTAWLTPTMPGCLTLREGNGGWIGGRDGIYDIDFATGTLKRIAEAPYNAANYRFNDGKNDRQGRLWVGAMPANSSDPILHGTGVLHRFDGVQVKPFIAPITSANGTVFSPDGRILYRAETRQRRIYAYDYNPETGTPSNERLFAQVPDHLGLPDGATIDSEGAYWAALPAGPDGGGVCRFTPDGKLDLVFQTPVLVPTMINFGGPDMSTLYITTAALEPEMGKPLSAWSGDLLAVDTSFKGVPETRAKPTAT